MKTHDIVAALIALLIIAVVAALICFVPVYGTTLATGCPENRPPATTAELNACLTTLDFDSVRGAGDEQRLMINPPCPPGPCRHGPLATIQPEKKSHRNTDADLQQGRILAKLFLQTGQTQSYPKLGLQPGSVTYWWVQQTSIRGGRSVYVRQDKLQQVVDTSVDRTFTFERHQNYKFKQALAGWRWSDSDETTWGTCNKGACCN